MLYWIALDKTEGNFILDSKGTYVTLTEDMWRWFKVDKAYIDDGCFSSCNVL